MANLYQQNEQYIPSKGDQEIPLKEAGWLGNVWWQDISTREVACRGCGKIEKVPVKWGTDRLCSVCNPDCRQEK